MGCKDLNEILNKNKQKCGKCGNIKPLNEFYVDENKKSGRWTYCKSCSIKISIEYKRQPPLKYRFNHGKPWTTKDLEYLKKYMYINTSLDLAYSLGRSVASIELKKQYIRKKEEEIRKSREEK